MQEIVCRAMKAFRCIQNHIDTRCKQATRQLMTFARLAIITETNVFDEIPAPRCMVL
jgi:hypothetical protein